MSTDEAIVKISAELEAATPGPWQAVVDPLFQCVGRPRGYWIRGPFDGDGDAVVDALLQPANATLIAHAPTYLAALLEVAKVTNSLLDELGGYPCYECGYTTVHGIGCRVAAGVAALDALTKAVEG